MATYKTFEDLDIWQDARKIAREIYLLSEKPNLKNDFALDNQMKRSCGSIMDNIAEGFERGSTKEFIQFLSYSKASAGELRSQLYRCFDVGYISNVEFDEIKNRLESISKRINGFISYLKRMDYRGNRFASEPEKQYENSLLEFQISNLKS